MQIGHRDINSLASPAER